ERVVVEPERRRLLLVVVVVGGAEERAASLGDAGRPTSVRMDVILREDLVAVQVDDGRDRTAEGLGAGGREGRSIDAVVARGRAQRIGPTNRLVAGTQARGAV